MAWVLPASHDFPATIAPVAAPGSSFDTVITPGGALAEPHSPSRSFGFQPATPERMMAHQYRRVHKM